MAGRKAGSNSIRYQKEARDRLATGIEPPILLTKAQRETFDGIIAELPMDDWGPNRIRQAASLAKLINYAEKVLKELIVEGPTYEHPSRGLMINPKQTAYNNTMNMIATQCRCLGVTASGTGVQGQQVVKRREAEQEVKKALNNAADDLLA